MLWLTLNLCFVCTNQKIESHVHIYIHSMLNSSTVDGSYGERYNYKVSFLHHTDIGKIFKQHMCCFTQGVYLFE
uniref:Uncharacterized protein n=1 Tax=Arundo donax TaxID=35708 RepID=A0A0A9AX81_ARUDO